MAHQLGSTNLQQLFWVLGGAQLQTCHKPHSKGCLSARIGIAGGSGPNGAAATNGTTVAELYNPAAPLGSRWTTVADSGIYRLYHSWSLLKNDATVCAPLQLTSH